MNEQNENNIVPDEGVRAPEKETRIYHTPVSEESEGIKEDIRVSGDKDRVAVEKDDKTVKDELEDYVFVNPRRRRRSSSSSSHSSSHSSSSDSVETSLVSGKHSRSHSHHHHHGHHSHHHHHRKKKMRKWQKVLIAILCIILSLILLITGAIAYLFIKGDSQLYPSDYSIFSPSDVEADVQDDGHYIVYNGKTYQYNEKVTSILFMGVDTRNLGDRTEETGTSGQADVIVLMAIDMGKRVTSLIAIPRDTMTDVAEYSEHGTYVDTATQQICLAYAYGDGKELSCENTVTATKRMFYNIPIESYYSLDLDGVSAVNDSIGGVDVVSPETIGEFVQGKSYHLKGKNAEEFIRARDTERLDASLLRLERQKLYASSFMSKLLGVTKKDVFAPVNLFNNSADYSCTNIDVSRIAALAKDVVLGDGMEFTMLTVPGEMTMGAEYAEYNIKPDEFYELFLNVYYNEI